MRVAPHCALLPAEVRVYGLDMHDRLQHGECERLDRVEHVAGDPLGTAVAHACGLRTRQRSQSCIFGQAEAPYCASGRVPAAP